jgi:glycosyltransferase involved in cell wall biosynthesis
VVDGQTGLMCRVRDAEDLARAMSQFAALPRHERITMGQRGRDRIAREFDEQVVITRYRAALATLHKPAS